MAFQVCSRGLQRGGAAIFKQRGAVVAASGTARAATLTRILSAGTPTLGIPAPVVAAQPLSVTGATPGDADARFNAATAATPRTVATASNPRRLFSVSTVIKEQQHQQQQQQEKQQTKQNDESESSRSPRTDPKELESKLLQLVRTTPIVLFLKGRPEEPLCGFSGKALHLLEAAGVEEYTFVDCSVQQQQHQQQKQQRLQLKEAVARVFDWKTLPLLVVDGRVIGGSDIMQQLHEQGQLSSILKAATSNNNKNSIAHSSVDCNNNHNEDKDH